MVVSIVAEAVDANAKKQSVRDFFVSHEGKKELVIYTGPSLQHVDYNDFLDKYDHQPYHCCISPLCDVLS